MWLLTTGPVAPNVQKFKCNRFQHRVRAIHYRSNTAHVPHYSLFCRWVPQPWSDCSRPCGGGRQKRDIVCMQRHGPNDDRRVKNKHCRGMIRPPRARSCNSEECVPEWKYGEWSEVRGSIISERGSNTFIRYEGCSLNQWDHTV